MPESPSIQFGILKCRDLVELYYGRRMVINVVQSFAETTVAGLNKIFGPDPRRIRYEIVINNQSSGFQLFELGTKAEVDAGNTLEYIVAPQSNIVIERSFLSDMEGVCLEQYCNSDLTVLDVSYRATYLTPAPIDEIP